MCSYPAISVFSDLDRTTPFVLHGEPVVAQPSCTSKYLKWMMRDVWGFNGFVESDCGAVMEAWLTHHFVGSGAEAAAAALNFGHTDIDCGGQYQGAKQFNDGGSIQKALDQNLTTMQNVEASLERRFSALFKLGLLDDPESQPFTKIPATALGWNLGTDFGTTTMFLKAGNSEARARVGRGESGTNTVSLAASLSMRSWVGNTSLTPTLRDPGWADVPGGRTGSRINAEAAQQSVVMLKRGSLPWPSSDTIAVIGPLANSTGYLLGTYRGAICPGFWNATTKQWGQNQCQTSHYNDPGCYCVPTVLSAMRELAGASVTYGGVGVDEN